MRLSLKFGSLDSTGQNETSFGSIDIVGDHVVVTKAANEVIEVLYAHV